MKHAEKERVSNVLIIVAALCWLLSLLFYSQSVFGNWDGPEWLVPWLAPIFDLVLASAFSRFAFTVIHKKDHPRDFASKELSRSPP